MEALCDCRKHRSMLLLYYSTMESLAEKVMDDCVRRRSSATERLRLSLIKWDHFPDGFPNIFINDVKEIAGRDVLFLAAMDDSASIFEQLALLIALPRYLAKSLTILLPYFPTGTMERIDHEGQIATAKTLATMLSCVPLCREGPAQIVIFDIHALQERFYFGSLVVPRLESAIPLLLERLEDLPEEDKAVLSIAFPDEGAYKRFNSFFSKYHTVICSKVRVGDKRIVTVKDGVVEGRHVVIVDDLVQTGGTLLECARALRELKCLSVSAYVTHAVFPNKSYEKFFAAGIFRHFWLTDSCPKVAQFLDGKAPFEVLSLAPAISKMLHEFDLKV